MKYFCADCFNAFDGKEAHDAHVETCQKIDWDNTVFVNLEELKKLEETCNWALRLVADHAPEDTDRTKAQKLLEE